jgi:hypothetical protein
MRNYHFFITGLSLAVLFITGCSKDGLQVFNLSTKVSIYKASSDPARDSVTYSFAVKAPGTTTDTLYIPLRIMGNAAGQNRSVALEIMSSSDADKDCYEILPAFIPADSFSGTAAVKVKNIPALKDREMRLWLKIINSEDLEQGAGDQLSYLIKINDFLSKPVSWSDAYFGKYSQVKYGLIIRETGYTSFSGITPSEYYYIIQSCKNAVLDYQLQTGSPMLDEFNDPVTFPK